MDHERHDGPRRGVTPAEAWELGYAESPQRWSGRPNATLVDLVGDLPPGRAVDLGCGEGADAVWLARRGWAVTGVDISPTAVARGRAVATEAGLTADDVTFVAADLVTWEPDDPVDLVTASFFHSREGLPRTAILRGLASHVAPGGHLAIVSHAAPPPGAPHAHHEELLLDAAGEVAELALGADWEVVVAEHRERVVASGEGARAARDAAPVAHEDVAVLLRRRS